ncbi:MAG: outer membrane protein assembly factor BamE [Oleiphilaceae bacterium]|nr:outer membrane protein assembly factor BamE [Oleiphilaceae bacterium]
MQNQQHSSSPLFHILITTLLISVLSACSFPGVYKINVQQGNIVTQEMLDQLKPGMTRNQVHFVLGNPVVDNVFSDEQEVYLYSYQKAGGDTKRQKVTVYYEGDSMLRYEGELLDEHPAY